MISQQCFKKNFQLEYEEKKKQEKMKKSQDMKVFMKSMMQGDACQTIDKETPKEMLGTDSGISFACHLCCGEFQNLIVTPCGYYFYEHC